MIGYLIIIFRKSYYIPTTFQFQRQVICTKLQSSLRPPSKKYLLRIIHTDCFFAQSFGLAISRHLQQEEEEKTYDSETRLTFWMVQFSVGVPHRRGRL